MKKYRIFLSIIFCVYLTFSFFSFGSFCAGGRGIGDGSLVPETEEEAVSWFDEVWERMTEPNSSGWTFLDRAAYSMTNLVDREAAWMGFFVPNMSTNYYTYLRPALCQKWGRALYQAQVTPLEWYNNNMQINYKDNGNTEPTRNDVETIDYSRQVMQDCYNVTNNYVLEYPQSFKKVYIESYSWLGTDYFNNYNAWKSITTYMKNHGGYYHILWVENSSSRGYPVHVLSIPSSLDLAFIGTVDGGLFTNVSLSCNWKLNPPLSTYVGYLHVAFSSTTGNQLSDGQFDSLSSNSTIPNLYNTTQLAPNNNWARRIVLNGSDKKSIEYVFETIQAYKNYNAGLPAPYYTDSQFDTYVPTPVNCNVNSPTTETYYNNIVNNIQNGMTPDELQKLIDEIFDKVGNGSGGGSGGSGSDTDLDLGFLGKIGELIAKLINGIGELITNVVGGIVDAVFNIIDLLTGENGLFSRLSALIDGSFNTFLADIFSWLPPEIITVFTASIVIGLFFGIWKIIRG